MAYHSAPVGARSKPNLLLKENWPILTTVPRWGRDQNHFTTTADDGGVLPQCPGGGEIKTGLGALPVSRLTYHSAPVGARSKRLLFGSDGDVHLPQCPGGGEIKTSKSAPASSAASYHSAPVGARSKPIKAGMWRSGELTTVPRWGRDQNALRVPAFQDRALPQCPGGGEIKTRDCSSSGVI